MTFAQSTFKNRCLREEFSPEKENPVGRTGLSEMCKGRVVLAYVSDGRMWFQKSEVEHWRNNARALGRK